MANKAYILSIGNTDIGLPYSGDLEIHERVTKMYGVENWWHYINNTYILIVPSVWTASDLRVRLQPLLPGRQFLVSEIKLSNHDGYLPKEAWTWINNWASKLKSFLR